MRTLMISAAALALTAGFALANPGLEQLANQAGVSANDYTQAQLIQLLQAQRDNDDALVGYIMSQASQNTVSRSDMGAGVVSNDAQLAAAAGVAPGSYTANELQRLITANRNNDMQAADFILSGQNRVDSNPASVVTPGQAQLAAALGVDAAQYTLSELTQLYAEWFGSDNS
jgi:ribonuclease D